jgi:hypothetical protein
LHGVPGRQVRHSMKGKRTLVALAVLAGMTSAIVERSNPALSKIAAAKIAEAFRAPLSLFADRSPSGRGSGALLSTKPDRRAGAAPHERVLSAVRDREAPLDVPAAADSSADSPATGSTPDDLAAGNAAPGTASANRAFNTSPFTAFPIGFSGFPAGSPFGAPPATVPTGSDVTPADQLAGPPPVTLPPSPAAPDAPEIIPESPSAPSPLGAPSGPPTSPLPSGPGTIAVPEPATWTIMALGLLIFGATVRRRMCKQSGLAGLPWLSGQGRWGNSLLRSWEFRLNPVTFLFRIGRKF